MQVTIPTTATESSTSDRMLLRLKWSVGSSSQEVERSLCKTCILLYDFVTNHKCYKFQRSGLFIPHNFRFLTITLLEFTAVRKSSLPVARNLFSTIGFLKSKTHGARVCFAHGSREALDRACCTPTKTSSTISYSRHGKIDRAFPFSWGCTVSTRVIISHVIDKLSSNSASLTSDDVVRASVSWEPHLQRGENRHTGETGYIVRAC